MEMKPLKDYDKFSAGSWETDEKKFFHELDDEFDFQAVLYGCSGHKSVYYFRGRPVAVEFSFCTDNHFFGSSSVSNSKMEEEFNENFLAFLRLCCKDVGMACNMFMFTTIALPIDTWKEELKTLLGLITK